jgi:hypothetical protein
MKINVIKDLWNETKVEYSCDNEQHEALLMEFWNVVFPDRPLENRISKEWSALGFQGKVLFLFSQTPHHPFACGWINIYGSDDDGDRIVDDDIRMIMVGSVDGDDDDGDDDVHHDDLVKNRTFTV